MTAKRLLGFDTETTGLVLGVDRVINFGAVLLEGGKLGMEFERFYNPGNTRIHPEAEKVHGLSASFLANYPSIEEGLMEIYGLLHGSDVIGHNPWFDLRMLDEEFVRAGLPKVSPVVGTVHDTVVMSRQRFPGGKHNLDALCTKLKIPLTERKNHGALVDARLSAKCFIFLNIQQSAMFGEVAAEIVAPTSAAVAASAANKASAFILRATEDDLVEHERYLQNLQRETKAPVVWLAGLAAPAATVDVIAADLVGEVEEVDAPSPTAGVEAPPLTDVPLEAYADESLDDETADAEAVPTY